MSHFEERLSAWGQEIEAIHLPLWDELPDFHLYMDQLVPFVNDHCAFLQITDDDKLLTPAMINNYVKQRIMPKPVKKRYSRVHLAYLMVLVSLKPVLSIQDIADGLQLQVVAFRGDYRAAYNLFCKQYERSLHHIGRVARGDLDSAHMIDKLPPSMLGMHMATLSVASHIFAKEVLSILRDMGQPLRRSTGLSNEANARAEGTPGPDKQ